MIVPTKMLPSTFGLSWGLSANECAKILGPPPKNASLPYFQVSLDLGDGFRDVDFIFEEGLHRVSNVWYDIRGYRHDWAQGVIWDPEDNLVSVIDDWDPERTGLFRIETELFAGELPKDLETLEAADLNVNIISLGSGWVRVESDRFIGQTTYGLQTTQIADLDVYTIQMLARGLKEEYELDKELKETYRQYDNIVRLYSLILG